MIFTTQHPGSWQEFMMKPENKALPIQEATRKYNSQMLMFENQYSTFLQQQQQLQSQSSSGGGPRQVPPRPLILEYTIVSPNTTISIPLGGANFTEYNFSVDWGDGEVVEGLVGNNSNLNAQMVHTYAEPGVYEIEILGTFPYTYLYGGTNKNLLTDIKQWGSTKWESFAESFRGCTGLTNITATDAPDLTRLKTQPLGDSGSVNIGPKADLFYTFRECSNLTNLNFTSNWDMSQVRVMAATFRLCSNLTDFSAIQNWNTSNLISMFGLLQATQLSSEDLQYIANWDVSNVRYLGQFFAQLNNISNVDAVANWNVSSVTNMSFMFGNSSVSDVSVLANWNPYQLESISSLFSFVTSLNNTMLEFLDVWNLSTVTNIDFMFYNSSGLSGTLDLSNWNISSLQNAEYMFFFSSPNSSISNINVTNWGVTNLTTVRKMFYNMNNADIIGLGTWNPTSLTNAFEMFENSKGFTGDGLGQWVNTPFQNINDMLFDNDSFDESLANWDISNLTNANTFMNAASGMSTANYDATLIGWAAQIPLSYNGTLNFGGSKYTPGGAAEAARTALIADVGAISDGGAAS